MLLEQKASTFEHSLLVDMHLRIAWLLVAGSESMASFCALSQTCFELSDSVRYVFECDAQVASEFGFTSIKSQVDLRVGVCETCECNSLFVNVHLLVFYCYLK